MESKEYKLFPKVAMIFKDDELKSNIDVDKIVQDIDFVLEQKQFSQNIPGYPGTQTLPIFWKSDIKWWKEKYNTDWEIIKNSFIKCCQDYMIKTQGDNANNMFPTYSKVWALKGLKNNPTENFIHNHSPSTLSGILYIKNGKNIGTMFFDSDDLKISNTITPEELDWLIFPSNLYHRPESLSDDERYVLACDLHIGVY